MRFCRSFFVSLAFLSLLGFSPAMAYPSDELDKSPDSSFESSNVCVEHNYCRAPLPSPQDYMLPESSALTLHSVQVLIRHGDRTPLKNFLNDQIPWHELTNAHDLHRLSTLPDFFPQIPSAKANSLLTMRGQFQQVQLGHRLRELYIYRLKFLPADYSSAAGFLRLRSTHMTRTVLSVKALMEGFFPDSKEDIPITIIKQSPCKDTTGCQDTRVIDSLLAGPQTCPRLNHLLQNVQKSPEYLNFGRKMLELERELRRRLDSPLPPLLNFFDISDAFSCRACHHQRDFPPGLPHVPAIDTTLANQFCDTAHRAYSWLLNTTGIDSEISRLQSGILIGELLQGLLKHANSSMPLFSVFSAHDSTIANLNSALATNRYEWPPYASNFIIESWKRTTDKDNSDGIFYVRILYNGKAVRLPWCKEEEMCPLDTFLRYTRRLVPECYECECALNPPA